MTSPQFMHQIPKFFIAVAFFALLQSKANAETWEAPYLGSSNQVLYLPDANAVYWRYGWVRNTTELQKGHIIKGHFPDVRYFSFNVYDDDSKSSVANLTDFQIQADDNNPNQYTIHLLPKGTKLVGKNNLLFDPKLKNISIILRHYLPNQDIHGSKPMPTIEEFDTSTNTITPAKPSKPIPKVSAEQARQYLLPLIKDYITNPEKFVHKIETPLSKSLNLEEIICKQVVANAFSYARPNQALHSYNFSTGGTYPNLDNHYLTMPVIRPSNEVLLLKFKAPSVSTSYKNKTDEDVRYFSISQGDELTYNHITLADTELRVHSNGFVYVAIGDDTTSIKAQSKALGINFIPWSVGEKMLVVYRNMLPKPSSKTGVHMVPNFDKSKNEAIQRGVNFIGDYSPVGNLISIASFMEIKDLSAH